MELEGLACLKGLAIGGNWFASYAAMTVPAVYRPLLWLQGVYSLLTALWGLLHIESFMAVTGPKADIWLVKTVSVLLIALVIPIFYGLIRRIYHVLIPLVSMTAALGLAAIDFYYTAIGRIKWVYALDGMIEMVFFTTWLYILFYKKHQP